MVVHLVPPAGGIGPRACAVVIDVLRASTTLSVAFERGASAVLPAASPEEALALRGRTPGALLCGEREGRRIPGFDLGNSPFEYDAATVRGRPLVFASTNGSIALRAAAGARRRVLAAFINAAAVVERLTGEAEVILICAGRLGRFALEDAACAGLLCQRLRRRGTGLAGAAELAAALAPREAAEVRALVEGSSHGRYLRSLGSEFARDVEFCAGLDVTNRVFEV